jgi:hypothetical protein
VNCRFVNHRNFERKLRSGVEPERVCSSVLNKLSWLFLLSWSWKIKRGKETRLFHIQLTFLNEIGGRCDSWSPPCWFSPASQLDWVLGGRRFDRIREINISLGCELSEHKFAYSSMRCPLRINVISIVPGSREPVWCGAHQIQRPHVSGLIGRLGFTDPMTESRSCDTITISTSNQARLRAELKHITNVLKSAPLVGRC